MFRKELERYWTICLYPLALLLAGALLRLLYGHQYSPEELSAITGSWGGLACRLAVLLLPVLLGLLQVRDENWRLLLIQPWPHLRVLAAKAGAGLILLTVALSLLWLGFWPLVPDNWRWFGSGDNPVVPVGGIVSLSYFLGWWAGLATATPLLSFGLFLLTGGLMALPVRGMNLGELILEGLGDIFLIELLLLPLLLAAALILLFSGYVRGRSRQNVFRAGLVLLSLLAALLLPPGFYTVWQRRTVPAEEMQNLRAGMLPGPVLKIAGTGIPPDLTWLHGPASPARGVRLVRYSPLERPEEWSDGTGEPEQFSLWRDDGRFAACLIQSGPRHRLTVQAVADGRGQLIWQPGEAAGLPGAWQPGTGRLWLTGRQGVVRFDPASRESRSFPMPPGVDQPACRSWLFGNETVFLLVRKAGEWIFFRMSGATGHWERHHTVSVPATGSPGEWLDPDHRFALLGNQFFLAGPASHEIVSWPGLMTGQAVCSDGNRRFEFRLGRGLLEIDRQGGSRLLTPLPGTCQWGRLWRDRCWLLVEKDGVYTLTVVEAATGRVQARHPLPPAGEYRASPQGERLLLVANTALLLAGFNQPATPPRVVLAPRP